MVYKKGQGVYRNAFLNSPWVKAIIPIRPGKELAAINWLKRANVEGEKGLEATYGGSDADLNLPQNATIEDALKALANKIKDLGEDMASVLATEQYFETGFDPLEGGFKATGVPFELFDQWIEILPTDQIVAVEYKTPE